MRPYRGVEDDTEYLGFTFVTKDGKLQLYKLNLIDHNRCYRINPLFLKLVSRRIFYMKGEGAYTFDEDQILGEILDSNRVSSKYLFASPFLRDSNRWPFTKEFTFMQDSVEANALSYLIGNLYLPGAQVPNSVSNKLPIDYPYLRQLLSYPYALETIIWLADLPDIEDLFEKREQSQIYTIEGVVYVPCPSYLHYLTDEQIIILLCILSVLAPRFFEELLSQLSGNKNLIRKFLSVVKLPREKELALLV